MPAPHRDSHLPPRTRRILHLDVDAFLASVEVSCFPELAGRPVVVGGSPKSRNLVMSCSYEARAHGIHPGMHLSEAQRRCPTAVFRMGDSQAAGRLRDQVTRILLGYSPRLEVASIDDFFLDLTGTARLHGAACDTALSIQREVRAQTRLPLSIGIACNRLMARLAGKLAKPGGIAELLPGQECAFLASLPVEHLPGVGHSIGGRLERFSIRTVGELRLVPREVLFASFGRDGLVLYERARGRDNAPVEISHHIDAADELIARPPHSIHRETTFEPEEGRPELIAAMLSYLVDRATHRLRSFSLVAGSIEVRIRYVDTNPRRRGTSADGSAPDDRGALGAARRRAFERPTDSTDEILRRARALLAELPRRRALVKRIGLTLHGLRPSGGWQGRLFSEDDALETPLFPGKEAEERAGTSRADRQRRLDDAIDRLRGEMGFGRILRGASLPLRETHGLGPDGFRLRTPSLNQ